MVESHANPARIASASGTTLEAASGRPKVPTKLWVTQSWHRCLALGYRPDEPIAFAPVHSHARRHATEEHTTLLDIARPELEQLARAVAPIRYFVMLASASAIVIDTAGAIDRRNRATGAIARVGVDLSEQRIGTSATSGALTERAPVWLHRDEHFFHDIGVYSCAGAPLFGANGTCLGVLDIVGVNAPRRPELELLAAQSARTVSDALVLAREHALRLRISWSAEAAVTGAASSGVICLDAEGLVVGANMTARRMLPALQDPAHEHAHASALFALPWPALFDLAAQGSVAAVPLWSGLRVHIAATRHEPGTTKTFAARATATATAPPTLQEMEAALIRRAMRDAGGRVAIAAQALGVSRATVYRKLAAQRRAKIDGSTT